MSVYNKTPYIVSVLSSLTQELQNALQVLIDTKNEPKLYSLINDDYKITTDDKGVNFVQLECKDKVITGYLVYNNTYCVIFGFNASQKVEIYNVDYANRKAEKVEEECSILEFRAVLEHLSLAASGGLKREIVETLPTEDIDTNTIYMVLATVPSANNYYIEYMYIGDAWEIIGSTATIDEIHYFDKEPVNGEFTVSSDEWTEAMNYDASMVQIKVGTDYYCLWKTKYDAATVYFTGTLNGVEHQAIFLKDGSNYSGSYTTLVQEPVIANPQLDGEEAELLSLQVGTTKYKAQSLSETDGVKFSFNSVSNYTISDSYSSYNRIGNEMTFVASFSITKTAADSGPIEIGEFKNIPAILFSKLVPTTVGTTDYLDNQKAGAFSDGFTNVDSSFALVKGTNNNVKINLQTSNLVENTKYHLRYMTSFLLTDNLSAIDPILANNSWADIKTVCESGDAGDYWAVGDTKTDLGTDGNTRTFRISDMQGLYNKHVVFEQVELVGNTLQWNPSSNVDDDNCYNNWNISNMRNTHLPAELLKFSSDLQAIITDTTIKTAKNGNSTTLVDTAQKLFLPAEKEVWTSKTYSRTEEFSALTTWSYWSIHTSNADHIKYDTTSTAKHYWLRSPGSGYTYYVCRVNNFGSASSADAYDIGRVAPCFAL